MARNENLEARVRHALAGVPNVAEKKMFGGMAFMVAGKLCVAAGDDELMFRIDPTLHETLVETHGCGEMLRNGKAIKGYVNVAEPALKSNKELDYWIGLALAYNKNAKATPKKVRP
jgi:TfoX/Sxy family transcriptional regulator of competence genes